MKKAPIKTLKATLHGREATLAIYEAGATTRDNPVGYYEIQVEGTIERPYYVVCAKGEKYGRGSLKSLEELRNSRLPYIACAYKMTTSGETIACDICDEDTLFAIYWNSKYDIPEDLGDLVKAYSFFIGDKFLSYNISMKRENGEITDEENLSGFTSEENLLDYVEHEIYEFKLV
jgi:hypothetical protein